MGLDDVELMMEIERQFGIEITEADYAQARPITVGNLHALIVRKLGPPGPPPCCPCLRQFHTVRQALLKLGVPRRRIRLATPLASLLPRARRRRQWHELRQALPGRLPSLAAPAWQRWAFWQGLLGVGKVLAVALGPVNLVLGVAPLAVAAGGAWVVARRWHCEIPPAAATVRDVVRLLPPPFPVALPDAEVWERLRQLVAQQLGAPLARIYPETDIYRDLGAG